MSEFRVDSCVTCEILLMLLTFGNRILFQHGKETPSPAIGIEGLEEDNSNPEATHSDKQHKEE